MMTTTREAVWELADSGLSASEIARRVGVSRERVRQLLPSYRPTVQRAISAIRGLIDSGTEYRVVVSGPKGMPRTCSECDEIMTGALATTWVEGNEYNKVCGRCYYKANKAARNAAGLRWRRDNQSQGVIPPDDVRCEGTTALGDRCRNLAVRCHWHRAPEEEES